MTAYLPPNLLALFAAREPIPYIAPVDKQSFEKKRLCYNGLAEYLSQFEEHRDEPTAVKAESREEKKERRKKEKLERNAYRLEQEIAMWDPHSVKGSTDPYKTLFVARVNYDTSEHRLRREFEEYGPIRKVYLVKDRNEDSRGYAFIEYEHERDMHAAYKHGDGKKIDGRRVLVDYERGRTVKGWRPRRLGGGLGGEKRRTRVEEPPPAPPKSDRRSREKEPDRDRDRRDRDRDRRDREHRDRDRGRRRSRSRSHSREKKRSKDEKRSKRDRSSDKSGRGERRERSKAVEDSNGDVNRRHRHSSGSEHGSLDPNNKGAVQYKTGIVPAAFDSDGEGPTKDKHDASSQGF